MQWSSLLNLRNLSVASMYASWWFTGNSAALYCGNLGSMTVAVDMVCSAISRKLEAFEDHHIYDKQVMLLTIETIPRVVSIGWYTVCASVLPRYSIENIWMWFAHSFVSAAFWFDVFYCSAILMAMATYRLVHAYAQPQLARALEELNQVLQRVARTLVPHPTASATALNHNTVLMSADDAAQQTEMCAICHDSLAARRIVSCGHVFHSGCLETWATQHSGTCPMCRARLDTDDTNDNIDNSDNSDNSDNMDTIDTADDPN